MESDKVNLGSWIRYGIPVLKQNIAVGLCFEIYLIYAGDKEK